MSLHLTYTIPGAMVLAHSLRDNGTKKQLAVLVTMETLEVTTIEELKVGSDQYPRGLDVDWSQ